MEESLRSAAFGDGVPPPSPFAVPASPRGRLLAAIGLGARGRYAAAATVLSGLRTDKDPVLASLAASTLASHRRQLGGHAAALVLDGEALALVIGESQGEPDPDGLDAEGARADAFLGLAADNLGRGRLAAARRLAARAGAHTGNWRSRTRAGWVGAEIELASNIFEAAIAPAEMALESARARGACRHVVKSQLVLAVAIANGSSAERERAKRLVADARETAEKYEFNSLLWVTCLVAADLGAGHADEYRFRSAELLHAVLRHADACGRWLARESPWVPG
ncbi:hypothetical protein [Amycolatopsis regifaucium]|uniref:Uncharacterized protein n=1 Tax=Amycolatopsis regifaucium TaxID=546365 RepID=A0A154MCY2_9PSEU|nr:hypothetical protein [Amycolatopsis regifaucium]KZB82120.1 hypothetical protein AVL48_09260 [Amycolatopsis regifaucium]OKA05808.1 hypothetical protein ATP06_0221730 [Amycolatopsis regifaucium]SFG83279.1 hypothetical protein SAMN04489731_101633 [Amycolatopsis regifaucium]